MIEVPGLEPHRLLRVLPVLGGDVKVQIIATDGLGPETILGELTLTAWRLDKIARRRPVVEHG